MKQTKTLRKRLADVYKWCDERNLNQIFNFFSVSDPKLREDEARIRYILRNPPTYLVESDEAWIASMEATIEALNARTVAA